MVKMWLCVIAGELPWIFAVEEQSIEIVCVVKQRKFSFKYINEFELRSEEFCLQQYLEETIFLFVSTKSATSIFEPRDDNDSVIVNNWAFTNSSRAKSQSLIWSQKKENVLRILKTIKNQFNKLPNTLCYPYRAQCIHSIYFSNSILFCQIAVAVDWVTR